MLDKVKRLKDSIQDEQFDEVAGILGADLFRLLWSALRSETEEDAKSRIREFGDGLRSHPLKAFGLYKLLNEEQKTIVQDLMEG